MKKGITNPFCNIAMKTVSTKLQRISAQLEEFILKHPLQLVAFQRYENCNCQNSGIVHSIINLDFLLFVGGMELVPFIFESAVLPH